MRHQQDRHQSVCRRQASSREHDRFISSKAEAHHLPRACALGRNTGVIRLTTNRIRGPARVHVAHSPARFRTAGVADSQAPGTMYVSSAGARNTIIPRSGIIIQTKVMSRCAPRAVGKTSHFLSFYRAQRARQPKNKTSRLRAVERQLAMTRSSQCRRLHTEENYLS